MFGNSTQKAYVGRQKPPISNATNAHLAVLHILMKLLTLRSVYLALLASIVAILDQKDVTNVTRDWFPFCQALQAHHHVNPVLLAQSVVLIH